MTAITTNPDADFTKHMAQREIDYKSLSKEQLIDELMRIERKDYYSKRVDLSKMITTHDLALKEREDKEKALENIQELPKEEKKKPGRPKKG